MAGCRPFVILASVFFLSSCAHQKSDLHFKPDFKVYHDVLKNGLTVLSVVDKTIPIVSYSSWFKVGSANEIPGKTGLAHLFEHLMFKGTKTYPGNSFIEMLEAKGAMVNAQTSKDGTYYYEVLTAKYLPLVIELEADRLKNLELTQKKLDAERKVVLEERRMRLESDFQAMQLEEMQAYAYGKHPYGWPVIGYQKDLDSLSVEECMSFFKTYYQPSNMVIVISGNFDYAETLKLIRQKYEDIESKEVPKISKEFSTVEKKITQNPIVLKKPVQTETLLVGYYTPSIYDEDNQTLEFLSDLLFEMRSNKLTQILVREKKIALDVGAGSLSTRLPSLFLIRVSIKPGQTSASALREIEAVFEKVGSDLNYFSDEELQRVKNRQIFQVISQSKSPFGVASAHAAGEIYWDDYDKVYELLDRFYNVQKSDLKKVAKKYLKNENRIVMILKKEEQQK